MLFRSLDAATARVAALQNRFKKATDTLEDVGARLLAAREAATDAHEALEAQEAILRAMSTHPAATPAPSATSPEADATILEQGPVAV